MKDKLEALKKECQSCEACGLCETRNNVVFGIGSPEAHVMFIGEAPGENEDLQGEPFVGRGGKLLDLMLDAVGLSRQKNIYIANTVKCRPPKNRDPEEKEVLACKKWLLAQIDIIKPDIIVCLGRISAQRFIDSGFRVTLEHGKWFNSNGILMMGTFHPAALLRNPNQKPIAMEDFFALRNKLLELYPEIFD